MRAIILAAGRGSRMKERTAALPKCLNEVWGRALLDWQLRALSRAGIEQVGVVTGYRAEMIAREGLQYFHNAEWERTNMVASLCKAEAWLLDAPCIVSYSDIVYEADAVRALMAAQGDIVVPHYTEFRPLWEERFADPLSDVESFRMKDGRLTEIGARVVAMDEVEGQFMGLLKITPDGWRRTRKHMAEGMPRPLAKMDVTALLSHLIARGEEVRTIACGGLWIEVDSGEDAELYQSWPQARYRSLLD